METRQVLPLLVLALLALPSPALAQSPAQRASPAPDTCVTAYYNFNTAGGLFEDRDQDAWTSGVGASLMLWGRGRFSAEFDVNYNRDFFGPAAEIGQSSLLTLTFGGVAGPWTRAGSGWLRPYLAFGGGWIRASVEDFHEVDWNETKNLGLVEAGGGLLWLFKNGFGIRGDVRYRWGVGGGADEGGWALIENWTYLRATIGVSLAF